MHVVQPADQQTGALELLAIVGFVLPERRISQPVDQVVFPFRVEEFEAGRGRRSQRAGGNAPVAGRADHLAVGPVQQQFAQVHGDQNDAVLGIKVVDPRHKGRIQSA